MKSGWVDDIADFVLLQQSINRCHIGRFKRNKATSVSEDGYGKYKKSGSFISVGLDPVRTIVIRYDRNNEIFIPGLPEQPTLLDMDGCMILFYLNEKLATKVAKIRIYANEYKLAEIDAATARIRPSLKSPEVSLVFSEAELADPWVIVGPHTDSFFQIRFSERTPKRYFLADEVPGPPPLGT